MVNTGDDFTHLNLRICPDLDTVMYTLSGESDVSKGWGRKNETWNMLSPLLRLAKVEKLIRAKVNYYPKTSEIVHHKDHTDWRFEHKGALFYLNDCDGLTVLEDGTEVESVANRLLLFDSSKPHHSTTTTNADRRLNINLNYF